MSISTPKRRKRTSGKRLAKQLERQRKARLAVEYLARGYGYGQAAEWAGFRAKSSCWAAVQELLETERVQASEEARALFGRRLDVLLEASMPDACEGDLEAMDRALAVLDRMDRLYGFSKPTKVAPTTPEGEDPAPGLLSWGDLMALAERAEQTARGG
jgi:hypothetical protein